ncbi:3-hydroxyacyl-CoA dehydrogenase [Nitratireductor aestuarii]|uniref:3-hydroxyacyl-CoA dehydrogenase n=1 Tax=Nitratireductor aestuarii TaxID=1735103 RepID=A0A916W894_9HYPH|nr:3-hydroxyacyl-CoA dehydrogenase NAD-binding domain-containing protein [Nitratireductor aestuarii]GGA75219.1 3-hydroxyacyl-CoA dehydrogenase [Nitratireductor aestuarii]
MPVTVEIIGSIGHVTIDNPPVNAISAAVRKGLLDAATALENNPDVKGVVLACAGKTFIAGADVTEFDKPAIEPHLPDVIAAIENSSKPWVAAIHGNALGGGLEIALGCRFRVADKGASLGLPETNLGIIPGSGGTVRTPRLIGVEAAVDLITSAKPVKAPKALQLGLVDAVVEGDLVEEAKKFLEDALTRDLPQRLCERGIEAPADGYWAETEVKVKKAAKGNTGPVDALASIRKAVTATFADALAFEREAFLRLRVSPQSAALRHIFFAERAAARPAEIKGVEPRSLTKIGVVGGGTMGAGIAAAMRDAGLPVHMVERDDEAVARGRANVEKIYKGSLAKGRLTQEQHDARLAGFSASANYADLADCDLVIEAVFEDLDVKRAVFAELAKVCSDKAILATNTSYLNPELIYEGLPHPERFIGLHFFSPANIMKLLEIVPTSQTAIDVLATGFELAKKAGKMPVRAGICDGFIGNRILKVTRAQAEKLLLAGCTPAEVDSALRGFGLAMGPFEVQDLAGLDIAAFQRQAARARGETPFAPVGDLVVAAGRLGQKTKGGWYDYTDAGRSNEIPAAVASAIEEARAASGVEARDWTADEIVEAIIYPMINEAAKIVEEGIALRDADIDLVKVHGYGFPRYRGGLVQYGRAVGFANVVASLEKLTAAKLADAPSAKLREWAN